MLEGTGIALAHHLTTPKGWSEGAPEGVGQGGGGGEDSLSISRLLRNSGAPSVLKQIMHKSSSLYTLFHSVIFIYISVLKTKGGAVTSIYDM